MRVSIFGMGYVGTVSGACLADLGHHVIGVDTNAHKIALLNGGQSPVVEEHIDALVARGSAGGRLRATENPAEAVHETELSIVSVGTPSDANGVPSLGAVDAVAGAIGAALRSKSAPHTVVIRSTVPPGTTESRIAEILTTRSGRVIGETLQLCFNPEFLREGSSVRDFHKPPQTIIGSVAPGGHDIVAALYTGIEAPVIHTTCRVAESVKYLANAFHALKIAFANEAGTLLKALGVDARDAMELFCRDRQLNISPAYLRPGFAFGGSCLPKDLQGLVNLAHAHHVQLPMLSNVMASNALHTERAFKMIARRGRSRVALFGLAFKPGTDDLRASPLVALAERLIGKGYDLVIYDPLVDASRLTGKNREFILQEIPHFERLMAPTPQAALEGASVIVVGHASAGVIQAIAAAGTGRAIIDLAGVPALSAIEGTDYEGICW